MPADRVLVDHKCPRVHGAHLAVRTIVPEVISPVEHSSVWSMISVFIIVAKHLISGVLVIRLCDKEPHRSNLWNEGFALAHSSR